MLAATAELVGAALLGAAEVDDSAADDEAGADDDAVAADDDAAGCPGAGALDDCAAVLADADAVGVASAYGLTISRICFSKLTSWSWICWKVNPRRCLPKAWIFAHRASSFWVVLASGRPGNDTSS